MGTFTELRGIPHRPRQGVGIEQVAHLLGAVETLEHIVAGGVEQIRGKGDGVEAEFTGSEPAQSDEFRDRFSVAGDDDLFTTLHCLDEFGEAGLCLVKVESLQMLVYMT